MGVIAETAVKVRADTSGFHREAQSGVMSSLTRIGAAAAGALGGLAIGKALFVDPIKSAGDFQQSLNVLQATSHATDGRMKEISATAMKLGNDTKLPAVSASDAANAMLELAKGGFSAKESMEGARGVLLLSTAAQIDGASAATLVADSLHAFGMKAKDAGVVVNDFAGAANASTASMSEVGQSLQQSGQAFHQLGIPIGDATTAIAAMANAGIKGSDAGTSLKTMLQRLNPQTKQAKQAMSEMGVSAFDSSGKFVGMRNVIEQMSPKLRAMTQEQRQHTLSTIFGSDASRAAGIILGQTTAQWDKQHAAVTKAGQAQALADAQTKGFKGAMAGLRSTIETVQLQIGLKMLPVLTTFVRFLSANLPAAVRFVGGVLSSFGDAIRKVADWLGVFQDKANAHGLDGLANGVDTTRTRFEEFVAVVKTVAGAVQTVAGVVGPILVSAFNAARAAITSVISTIASIVGWLNQNRDVAIALGAGIAAAAVAFGLWQAALLAANVAGRIYAATQLLMNVAMEAFPAIAIITAIALLVAGLVLLYQRSETARTIMDAAFNGMKAVAAAALGFIANTVIPAGVAAIKGIVTAVDFVKSHWDTVWKAIGPVVTAAFNIVKIEVQTAITVITQVIDLFKNVLEGHWGAAWGNIKTIVTTILNAAIAIMKQILNAAVATLEGIGRLIAAGIAAGVKAVIGLLSSLGGSLVSTVVGAVRGVIGGAKSAAENVASAIAGGIKTAAGKLAGLAGDITGKISAAISQVAGWAYGEAAKIGASIASGIVSGVGDLAGSLKSKVTGAIGGALGGIGGFIKKGSPSRLFADEIGKPIGDGITMGAYEALNLMGGTIGGKLREVALQVASATKANEGEVVKAVKGWASAAKTAFDNEASKLKDVLGKQLDAAKSRIDKWKASLTPAEVQLKTEQAHKALADLQNSLNAAWTALKALPQQQADQMAALLKQQKDTMDGLVAQQHATLTDASVAQHEYEKGITANASDPLALGLVQAQQNLITQRALYDQGQITLDQLLAYQDAFDAASIAAADDTNAQKLLSDYTAWQNLATQASSQGENIKTTEQQNLDARKGLQDTFNQQIIDATATKDAALQTMLDNNLQAVADKERGDRDRAATELNNALVARYARIQTHFENVVKATNAHYEELARHATSGGHTVGDNLAQALRDTIPNIARAAGEVATELKKYLKLSSPSEKGPLSDLDRWWTNLAPTLISSFDASQVRAKLAYAVTPSDAHISGAAGQASVGWGSRTGWTPERMEYLLERIEKHTGATAGKPNAGAPEIHVSGGIGIDASAYRSKR